MTTIWSIVKLQAFRTIFRYEDAKCIRGRGCECEHVKQNKTLFELTLSAKQNLFIIDNQSQFNNNMQLHLQKFDFENSIKSKKFYCL